MHKDLWLGKIVLLVAAALLSVPAAGQGQPAQDSLAEAARKARAQKKTSAKPVKVYTNDNLPKAATAEAPAPSSAEKTESASEEQAGAAAAEKKDEAYWRGQFKEARENLARAEKELDILQRELQKADLQYYPDPTKAMREQYDRKDINDKTAKIEAKKKEVAGLKQAIENLETELRRSGGDPGWAR
jgi:DNA repair exonuclease SbcCD ATPase subunit